MTIEANDVDAAFAAAFPDAAFAASPPDEPIEAANGGIERDGAGELAAATEAAAASRSVPEEEIHDFTGTTQSVENSHIVSNTRNSYYRSLTDLMIWIFSFSPHKLVNQEALIAAKAQDDQRGTEKQRKAKNILGKNVEIN